MLTQEYLKSILHYNPTTGIFTWINSKRNGWNGKEAGSLMNGGYIHIGVAGKLYLGHRLAFLCMTGSMPEFVDHINEVKSDNRWCNLRKCTKSQNHANILNPPVTNKSGYRGVSWHRHTKKWTAQISHDSKKIYLGVFNTQEAAHEAYKKAHLELFGEFSPFSG